MEGTWQAAAWYLERTQPERYPAKRRAGAGGRPVGAIPWPTSLSAVPT